MSTHGNIKKAAIAALQRVVGQAYQEGATREAIVAHLNAEGVTDPDPIITRVEGMKIIPLLGGVELKKYGGRNKFRALFGLADAAAPPPNAEPEDYPLTESGDAEHFCQMFSDRVRYNHRTERWLVSDDETGLWIPDKTGEIYELAKVAQRERQKRAMMVEDQRRRKDVMDWAVKGENRNRLTNMLALAESIPPVADSGEHWDVDPFLIGCLNGVVDLRSAEVRKALPEERITMQVRVPFDPAARSQLWEDSLERIFAPPSSIPSPSSPSDMLDGAAEPEPNTYTREMINFMQRSLGYSITGDCREECCFFAVGEGGNGKGTVFNTVGYVLDGYAVDMPYTTLEKQVFGGGISSDVARLDGKRFITSSEVNEFHINESRLKALSGRDPITARFLYQNEFTFIPVGKIWISTNNKPKIMGQDDGIWRRIYLVQFMHKFEGQDKDLTLKDRLREPSELAGIFTWLVLGAKAWYLHGLMPPTTVLAATAEYREESDPLTPFIEECCVIGQHKMQAKLAWAAYLNYCSRYQVSDTWRMSTKRFHLALRRRFKVEEGRNTSYIGVGLADERHAERRTDL